MQRVPLQCSQVNALILLIPIPAAAASSVPASAPTAAGVAHCELDGVHHHSEGALQHQDVLLSLRHARLCPVRLNAQRLQVRDVAGIGHLGADDLHLEPLPQGVQAHCLHAAAAPHCSVHCLCHQGGQAQLLCPEVCHACCAPADGANHQAHLAHGALSDSSGQALDLLAL